MHQNPHHCLWHTARPAASELVLLSETPLEGVSALCHIPRSCSLVRSSRRSAGGERYSVLLYSHTAEPHSSKFADIRLSNICTTVTFLLRVTSYSLSLQSGSTLTKYDDFRRSHPLLSQRNTKNCKRSIDLPRTDNFKVYMATTNAVC